MKQSDHCFVLCATLAAFGQLMAADVNANEQMPVARQSDPVMPAGYIALRNNSRHHLEFFLLREDSWKLYKLGAAEEVEIPRSDDVVAISTMRGENDPEADLPPAKTTAPSVVGDAPAAFEIDGPYFLRRLSDTWRWEFCWSSKINRWVVQHLHEELCG